MDGRHMSKTTVGANGETNQLSPWANKLILSIDGGGVKGYSSLLILKRLVCLIEEFERGIRPLSTGKRLEANDYSWSYPWYSERQSVESSTITSDNEERNLDYQDDNIEESVRRCLAKEQSSQFKLHHYFDYMAGTSAGGLSAIMLGRLEMSVQDALWSYDIVSDEVFGNPRMFHTSFRFANLIRAKYPSKRMKRALVSVIKGAVQYHLEEAHQRNLDEVAEQLQFQSNPARCRTMVVAYMKSPRVSTRYLFRTYDHHSPPAAALEKTKQAHLNPGKAHTHPIWKVARATSAAPTYFSPFALEGYEFRDGGMVANNPAKLALTEVQQMHMPNPKLLLSIGTGTLGQPEPDFSTAVKPKKVGLVKRWSNEIKAGVQLLTETTVTHLDVQHEHLRSNSAFDYYRLDTDEVGKILLDNWEPAKGGAKTKEHMIDLTAQYLSKDIIHKELVDCAEKLVRVRRLRAESERWEAFACKCIYYCPEPQCRKVTFRPFLERNNLRRHGYFTHGYVVILPAKGDGDFPYTCVIDTCRHEGIHLFKNEEDFNTHLKSAHSIHQPQFVTRDKMEEWLDKGREPL